MDAKEILDHIEDKDFIPDTNWYLHATKNDVETIKKILQEGIKAAYLRNEKGNHYNGRYFISLYKHTRDAERLNLWLRDCPKFIIDGISPIYADRSKIKSRHMFINTRIPLRTSEWDGEFQQYLEIKPSKILALEYSLSNMLSTLDEYDMKEKLIFLKNLFLCLEQINSVLPIYDLSSNREFNKQKVLSIKL